LTLPCAGVEVTVTLGVACGRPYLILTARVGSRDALDPRRALEHSRTLAVGALVLDEDGYVLRHALPLDGTPAWRRRHCVEVVAQAAARLAAGCLHGDGTFDIYAD